MIRVIIADNESLFRRGLASILKQHNIAVVAEAENGKVLLELLPTVEVDLILLDLEMPVLNGSKTLDIIMQKYPGAKVIMLSSYHDEQIIFDHLNRGARAYVSKTEDVPTLVNAIECVNRGCVFRENIPRLLKIQRNKDRHYYKLLFTNRELEIIHYLCSATSVKEITLALSVSQKTVETHLTEIYKKLNVKNRMEFLRVALKEGFEYLGNPNSEKKKCDPSA